jgi:hypothetical protein
MLNVEYRKVEALIPYARNPRTHNDEQVAKIAASIVEYGWTNPVLVDGDNGIIAGHGRLAAAHKLGLTEVPVIELAHLSPTQKRAYVISDNRLALDAGWDIRPGPCVGPPMRRARAATPGINPGAAAAVATATGLAMGSGTTGCCRPATWLAWNAAPAP